MLLVKFKFPKVKETLECFELNRYGKQEERMGLTDTHSTILLFY